MSHLRATWRTLAIIAVTGVLLPVFLTARRFRPEHRAAIKSAWFRSVAQIAGLTIKIHGTPDGALIVANHISYLDIIAIGAQRDVTFVAKGEVAAWPVIGGLAQLAGTIFVERARSDAKAQIDEVSRALIAGRTVVLFPEGTSTRGEDVPPYKSSLFQAAIDHARTSRLRVQPLTIAYLRNLQGRPLAADERSIHPWVGDDSLVPHLWTVLGHRGVEIDIAFHHPIGLRGDESRKALAERCRQSTAFGLVHLRHRSQDEAVWDRASTEGWADVLDRPSWSAMD